MRPPRVLPSRSADQLPNRASQEDTTGNDDQPTVAPGHAQRVLDGASRQYWYFYVDELLGKITG